MTATVDPSAEQMARAPGSGIGRRTAEDARANLARDATFRGMTLRLDEV
jgi:hypothetical protein